MRKHIKIICLIVTGLIALGLSLLRPQPAHAQGICLDFYGPLSSPEGYKIGSSGNYNTLEEDLMVAINCANISTSNDVIDLNGKTITLQQAFANFDQDGYNGLTPILGGMGSLKIKNGVIERDSALDCSTNGTSRTKFRLLWNEGVLTLENLTLRNGCARDISSSTTDEYGGAIYNRGVLRLNGVHLVGNTGGIGGAIFSNWVVIGANVSFVDNTVQGITKLGASLAQTNSIYRTTLVNTTFSQNDTAGAQLIWMEDEGGLTLINSTITANVGGGEAIAFANTAQDNGSHVLHNVILAHNSINENCDLSVRTAANLSATGSYSDDNSCGFASRGGNDNASVTFGSPTTASNGTQYHPLLAGDPINGGDNSLLPTEAALGIDVDQDGTIETTTISIDQRGGSRVQAGTVDGGAYEIGCDDYNPALATTSGYIVGSVIADLVTDLRQAIACANSNGSDDRITLDGQTVTLNNAPASYDLSGYNGLPPIQNSGTLLIEGGIIERNGTLDCNGDSGDRTEFRLLYVRSSATTLSLQNLTLRNGCAQDISDAQFDTYGGAILNLGTLHLNAVHLADNLAQFGGAIDNNGSVFGANVSFVGNSLHSTGQGAAVRNIGDGDQMTLVNATFSQNNADIEIIRVIGAFNFTLINSTFYANTGSPHAISFNEDAQNSGNHTFYNVILGGSGVSNCNDLVQSAANLSAIGSYSDDDSCGFAGRGGSDNASVTFGNLTTAANGTQYHPLIDGDPLNGGDNSLLPTEADLGIDVDQDGTIEATTIAIDQRGGSRIQAGTVDGGAYEISCDDYDTALASTAGYTVGSVSTDLVTDLRQAIACANNNGSDDRITLNGQTVTLNDAPAAYDSFSYGYNGLPIIQSSGSLTIGEGVIERNGTLDCNGDSGDRTEFRLLQVNFDATLSLQNLTLRNGCTQDSSFSGYGGAILNMGDTLRLNAVHLADNRAEFGGAIAHFFNVLIGTNVSFVGNSIHSNGSGAALYHSSTGAQMTLVNATFSQNVAHVGAVVRLHRAGESTFINTTFYANTGSVISFKENSLISSNNAFHNVILAGNSGSNCSVDVQDATILSATGSYSDDASCDFASRGGSDNASVSFGLLTTAANGTQYHPLTGGDPLNGGDNSLLPTEADLGIDVDQDGTIEATAIAIDQRGGSRIVLGTVDGGAHEQNCTELGYVFPYTVGTVLSADHATDLSNAITCANANDNPDLITLAADVVLTEVNNTQSGNNGLPPITSYITLQGTGYTLSRDSSFSCNVSSDSDPDFRLLRVTSAGTLFLHNVSLQNGCAAGNSTVGRGGAIWNDGFVQIANGDVSGNKASYFGAGLYTSPSGSLVLSISTVRNNQRLAGGTLEGGGVYSAGYQTTINFSLIEGNSADTGAGIANAGNMLIRQSVVSNNMAATFGQAAGIYNSGSLGVVNSTVSGNTQFAEGAVFNDSGGTLSLRYSTIAANETAVNSGGLVNDGALSLNGTLIADNTMLLTPAANVDCDNRAGSVTDEGYNLVETATTCVTDGTNNNQVGVDPLLEALADNGGSTLTHALQDGSAAIDAGNSVCTANFVDGLDQRGVARPQGSTCDIGAYEAETQMAMTPTLTMYPDGSYGWTPDQSGCTESLYRGSTPYVGHTWLTDDPANYDGSGSLTSVAINYFYYLRVDCGGSQSQSNEVGEFTFAIVPGN